MVEFECFFLILIFVKLDESVFGVVVVDVLGDCYGVLLGLEIVEFGYLFL